MIATLRGQDEVGTLTAETPNAPGGNDDTADVVAFDLTRFDEVPDERWSLDELTARVIAECGRIAREEQSVTLPHWHLGKALNAARKRFKRVEWGQYLKACNVSEDVARAARALPKLYDSPEGLERLSVREALRLAKAQVPDPTAARLVRNLELRLKSAIKAARIVSQKTAGREERIALVRSLESTIETLDTLCKAVKG